MKIFNVLCFLCICAVIIYYAIILCVRIYQSVKDYYNMIRGLNK